MSAVTQYFFQFRQRRLKFPQTCLCYKSNPELQWYANYSNLRCDGLGHGRPICQLNRWICKLLDKCQAVTLSEPLHFTATPHLFFPTFLPTKLPAHSFSPLQTRTAILLPKPRYIQPDIDNELWPPHTLHPRQVLSADTLLQPYFPRALPRGHLSVVSFHGGVDVIV